MPKNNNSYVLAVIGITAAAGLLLVLWFAADAPESRDGRAADVEHAASDSEAATRRDAGSDAHSMPAPPAWPAGEPSGVVLRAQDGADGDEFEWLVGLPGRYPTLEVRGVEVLLPHAAPTLRGESVSWAEVYVRTPNGAFAFWDLVPSAESTELLLEQARSVRFCASVDGVAPRRVAGRVTRDGVGLVQRDATADGACVGFDGLPAGSYVLDLMAEPGRPVVRRFDVRVDGPQVEEVRVELAAGRSVSGVVMDSAGVPAIGALVALFADSAAGSTRLAEAVTATDDKGAFSFRGVPAGRVRLTARATNGEAASTGWRDAANGDLSGVDIELQPGLSVTVRVVDEQGAPVGGATVAWSNEGLGPGLGGMTRTGVDGEARVAALSRGSSLRASLGVWRTEETTVNESSEVTLTLRKSGPALRFRMVGADNGAAPVPSIRQGKTTCGVFPANERDFFIDGCVRGPATIQARTPAGLVSIDVELSDGFEVVVPAPTAVQIEIAGAADEDWSASSVLFSGPAVVSASLEPTGAGTAIARAQLYPGTWSLEVRTPRIGVQRFPVRVGDRATPNRVSLSAIRTAQFWVVDRQNAPVNGARAFLFARDGTLLDTARSSGQLPTQLRARPPLDANILVVDPRRGEAVLEVSFDKPPSELRVQLSSAVGSSSLSGRLDIASIEARSGATLSADGAGSRFDQVLPGSKAARAGIQRGDWLVTAWEAGQATRMIVWRAGAYIDVRL